MSNRQLIKFLGKTRLFFGFGTLFLVACGGGGGAPSSSTTSTKTGQFIDSAVEGARYSTATKSGTTDSSGIFSYLAGEAVSFYIGGILIGSASGATRVTPLDFIAGATDASNPQVTNILRFLQSLDSDNNPANGINISTLVSTQASGQTLDFNLPTAAFELRADALLNMLTSGSVTSLISASAAQAHFNASVSVGGSPETITLSGADTIVLGTTFKPDPAATTATFIDNSGGIAWGEISSTGGRVASFSIALSENKISTFSFTIVLTSSPSETYSYFAHCTLTPLVCANADIDINSKELTLNSISLPVSASVTNNMATAPMVFDGLLTWK